MLLREMKKHKISAIFLHNDNFPTEANIKYLTDFECEFISVLRTQKKNVLLTTGFEVSRAKKESKSTAWDWNSFDYKDNVKKTKDRDKALILSIMSLLKKEKIKKLWVPRTFSSFLYNGIKRFVKVEYLPSIIEESRAVKNKDEISKMKKAQKSTDKAMQAAIDLITKFFLSFVKLLSLFLVTKVMSSILIPPQDE